MYKFADSHENPNANYKSTKCVCIYIYLGRYYTSGQIIATSPDLTPNGGLVRTGNPLISGKSRLVKYFNLARYMDPVG